MSKFEKVKVSLFAFITTLSIISIFSCEIGLGAAVDTEAPNINITVPNPESVAVIRDSFPIMGNWSDDGEIESIKVVITSNSSNQQFTKNAEFTTPAKGETGGSWSVFFEPEAEGILDGAYSVNITIEDTVGHSTETSSQIRIDNTPPLIVLQRPSTILSDNSFDPYGKTFSLIGQSTDENGVTLMKLNFYHNSDLSDTPTEIELSKVPDTINFDIARFELNKQNAYSNIYESTTLNGTKEAYFNLTAYDGAQKYEPNGTQTAEDTFGNPATVYYLYDDISELITSYKVTGLYKILAGTYDTSEAGRSAGQSSTVLNQLQQKQVSAGKFSLNPANTPTYTLSGGDRLELPSPNISECGEFFATGNHDNIVLSLGSSIQFNVIPGLDGVSLLENTLIPYAIEYPEPAGGENKLEIEVLSRKQSSTSDGTTVYKIEGLISESNGFETNKCYRIVLEGKDKENIGVEPEGNGYGFYCRKVGDGPKLEITLPEEVNVDKKAGDTVTISGNVEFTENGLLEILLNRMGETPVTIFSYDTTSGSATGITQDNDITTKYYYTYTIPATSFNQTSSDKYKIEVQASGDSITVSKSRSVVYDVENPEASIFAPEPIAHKYSYAGEQQTGDYLNKTIKIKANVKDTGGSDVDLENTHLQYNSTNGTSGWRDYTAAEILKGTNTYSVDTENLTGLTNGNVYFRVNVKDNSGNEANSSVIGPYIVDQDTDKPVILPGKDWMAFYNTDNANFDEDFTRNLLQVKKVYFKLVDDDDNGLQSVSVKVYKADGSEITDTAVTSVKDFSAGKKECTCYFETKNLDEGKYRVVVTALDKNGAGADASKETWINITAAAPRLSNISIDNKYVTTNGDSIAPATATEPFSNAKKKIKASFKINSTSAPFKLTYKITAADGTLIKDFDAENSATELTAANYDSSTQLWSYEITPETSWTAGNKKAFKLQLKVFDKNHNEGLQNTPLDFYIDNSQPVVTANTGVATPTAAETEGNSWDFDISASDTDGDSAYPAKYFIAFANKADDVSGTISNRTGWLDATSLKSYPLTYTNLPAVFGTADAPNSGKKVVYVKVQDSVGNISNEFSTEFNYDKGDPSAAITGYTIGSEVTTITENKFFAKGLFTLSASAEDDWAIDSLELIETKTKDGIATTGSPIAVKLDSGVLKKADDTTLNLPSTGLDTAEYKYTLKATDKAEKTTASSEVFVQIDQTAPALTLNDISSAPLNGLVAFSGRASDEGLGLKSLLHKIVADGSEDPADSSLNASELSPTLSTSWRLSVETLAGKPETGTNAITWDAAAGKYTLYEGKYKLYARAKDKADNVSDNTHSIGYASTPVSSFIVDYAKPEVASAKLIVGSDEAAITGSGLNYFKAESSSLVKVSFIVKETNGLDEVKINNDTQTITAPDADGNYIFEYTIPAASYTGTNANKAIDIKLDLKDIAGRENSVTYKIYNDTEKPEISIDNPATNVSGTSSIAGASFIFSATVKDKANESGTSGSGLKEGKFNYIFTKDELTNEAEIKAAATGSNGTAATPGSTGNWTITKQLGNGTSGTDTSKLYEGEWNLYIYAEDAEGNGETAGRLFWIDQAVPVISDLTSLNEIYNEGFTLSGKARDANGIASITVKDNTDTIPAAAVTITSTENGEKTFTIDFITGDTAAQTGKYKLTDGAHELTIIAEDSAGKTTEEKLSVTVDTTKPTITSMEIATADAEIGSSPAQKWYKSEYVGVTVTGVSDGTGTGIKKVEVSSNGSSWTELSSSVAGTYTGSAYCSAQGENTISLKVTDNAGNVDNSNSRLVYIDTEEPDTLEITKIEVDGQERTVTGLTDILVNGSETSGITIRARAVDANASATDKASGIAKVTLTKPVDTAIEVTTEEDSTNAPGVYLITIPTAKFKSGPIVLTATDKVGKVKTLNTGLKITLDNTPPEVKKTNVPSAVNGKLALSGTVYDNRSAFKSVDVFYYVDSNVTGYKKWVSCYHDVYTAATDTTDEHKPSANWKLEKTVAEDGTVTDTRLDTAAFTSAGVTDNTKIYILTVVYDEAGKCNIALGSDGKPAQTPTEITSASPTSIEEITLNQDGDRPEITLNGLDIRSMSANNLVKLSESSVSGRITDDDGVTELYYSVDDGTNWLPITLAQAASTNTTFTWTEPAEGTYSGEDEKPTIKFKVVDTEGGTFITQSDTSAITGTPKFAKGPTGSGAADLSTEGLYLIIDRTAPSVRNIGIKTSATATEYSGDITGTTVGGDSDHNKFWLQLEAYDINGIVSVTAKLTGGEGFTPVTKNFNAGTQSEEDGYIPYTMASPFDVSGYESGTYNLSIKVDDGTKPTEMKYTIKVDNDAPLVQVNNHEADELISSAFNLKGDIRGSDDGTQLWYAVTKSDTEPTVWTKADNTAGEVVGIGTGKWSVSFDDGTTDETSTHSLSPKELILALTTSPALEKNAGGAIVYAASEGANAGTVYRTTENYYFHFLVKDKYGNENSSYYQCRIDPTGDIPVVRRTETDDEVNGWVTSTGTWYVSNDNNWGLSKDAPAPAGYDKSYPAALMSGVARISGTANAQNGIKAIYMQVDPSFNGISFNDNWAEETLPNTIKINNTPTSVTIKDNYSDLKLDYERMGNSNLYGIRIASGQTWSFAFNKQSEFENTGNEKNIIAIRLYVVDKNNNISLTDDDDLFVIRLDSGAPKIGSSIPLVLRQYSDNDNGTGTVTKEIRYEKNMWVKGIWWIYGSVEDANGISSLIIDGNTLVQRNSTTNEIETVANDNGSAESKTWSATNTSGFTFKYKVGSKDKNSSSLSYVVTVLDTDSNPTYATETIVIKYDNKPPTLVTEGSNYNIPVNVKNSYGFYSLQASAKENSNESGFLRAVFYFKRDLTGLEYVYDSYLKKSHVENQLAYAGLMYGDEGLYWKEIDISSVSGSTVNISTESANIHKGGLAKLKGAYYRIDNVSGTEVTLDESLDELSIASSDKLYVAIGHVVDHEGSETPSTSADIEKSAEAYYGYYKTLTDDDGDRMIESVSPGTETIWSASINSNNIPDGEIEIHYVVFDAAGNYAHGVVKSEGETKVVVGNNAPRLAGLKVTSGAISETFYYEQHSRKINGVYEPRATDLTTKLIVSGNKKDAENGGTAFMTAKDQIEFIPEIVGGNGALSYTYTVSHTQSDNTIKTLTGSSPDTWSAAGFDDGIDEEADSDGYYKISGKETYYEAHPIEPILFGTAEMTSLGKNSKEGSPTWFNYTLSDSTAGGSLNVEFQCALNIKYFDDVPPTISVTPLYWNSEKDNSLYQNSRENGHIELKKYLTPALKTSAYGGEHDKVSGKITMRGSASDNIRVKELWVKPIAGLFTSDKKIATYDGTNWNPVSTDMAANNWTCTVKNEQDDVNGHIVNWTFSWDTSKITGTAKAGVVFEIYAKDEERGGKQNDSTKDADGNAVTPTTYTVDVVPYITDVETSLSSIQSTNPSVYSRTALGHYPVYIVIIPDVKDEKITYKVEGETITYKGFNLGANPTYPVTTDSVSGEYDVTVNEIKSINNKNDDTKDYNKCPNKENNDKLTDNVFLDVWQFNSKAAVPIEGKIEQAVMKINPVNDQIGFAFVNGSFWTSMADASNSYRTWMTSKDFCTSTSFIYDKNGNTYGVMAGGDSGQMADKYNFITSRWGVSNAGNTPRDDGLASRDGSNALRIEELCDNKYSDAAFAKQRFVSSSLAVSTHDENTNVYLAYFDSLYNQIRFRAGTMYVCPIDYYDNGGNGYTYGHVTLPANQTAFTNNIQITFCDETGKELTAEEYANIGWGDRAKYFVSKASHNNNSTDWWFTLAKEENGQNLEDRKNNDRKQFWNGEYTLRNNNNGTRIPTQRLYIKFNAESKSNFGNFVDACTARDGWGSYADARKYAQVLASGETPVATGVDDIPGAKAGSSVSIGVTEDNNGNDVVVAVWYDEVNYKMWYAYNTSPTTDRANGKRNDSNTDDGWSTPEEVFTGDMEKAGSYCKVAVDASGGVHIAAFDMANNNVVYAYATSYNSSFTTCLVDGNIPSGEYLTLDVALDTSGNAVPYIGYYSQGCVRPKMAYAVTASTNAGTDANGYMTGDWEITVVPTPKQVETQSNQHNPINIGVWKTGAGVLKNSTFATSTLTGSGASDMSGKIYGNGTSNPVLGYVITDDTIETAQKK